MVKLSGSNLSVHRLWTQRLRVDLNPTIEIYEWSNANPKRVIESLKAVLSLCESQRYFGLPKLTNSSSLGI